MGKTKTKSRSNSKDILRSANAPLVKSSIPSQSQKSTEILLEEAATHLEHSQPEQALPLIQEALKRLEADKAAYADIDTLLKAAAQEKATFPQALTLGGDICLALGDVDKARVQFELAVQIDPNGALISAEPYLQLAQLCEDGGKKSIYYFDKAIEVMKNEIEVLDEQMDIEGTQEVLDSLRSSIADALCGMTEVYMTDLSWEPDAEQRCEQFVTEAVALSETNVGVLQTLASLRISQERFEEAKQALAQSLSIWQSMALDSPQRPEFATRVILVRLLMEVEMESEAMSVLEGLVKEDDQSVEAWYLGGWCHLLLSQKEGVSESDKSTQIEASRTWLVACLKLYDKLEYEDVKLHKHAQELIQQLNHELGDDEWETDDEKDMESDESEIEADPDVEMT